MRLNEELILKNKILEAIIKKIENDFQDDVSILTCYGSYITGGYNKFSDINFFFIPKTDKGYDLSYQFIINEIGYDLWPISWERAKRIANLDEQLISIIMDGEILYYSSYQDLNKYDDFKRQITKNLLNKEFIAKKVNNLLSEIKSIYFDINQVNDNINIPQVYRALEKYLFALALINGKYLLKGIENIENEIRMFAIIPKDFLKNYYELINFESHKKVSTILLKMINDFPDITKSYVENGDQQPNPKELIGFYEEFKSIYNKFIQACKHENYAAAIYSSLLISRETDNFLKQYIKTDEFPELTYFVRQKKYQYAIELCKTHEKLLLKLLKDNKVSINYFDNIDIFAKYFQSLKIDKQRRRKQKFIKIF